VQRFREFPKLGTKVLEPYVFAKVQRNKGRRISIDSVLKPYVFAKAQRIALTMINGQCGLELRSIYAKSVNQRKFFCFRVAHVDRGMFYL